jgi:Mg-chelatase subunit ChlD
MKATYALRAAQSLVAQLADDDRLSAVIFDDTADTLLAPDFAKEKATIQALLGKVKAGGCTNLSGGWLSGCKHVKTHASGEQVNRVLLLTDGQANVGVTANDVLIPPLCMSPGGRRLTVDNRCEWVNRESRAGCAALPAFQRERPRREE